MKTITYFFAPASPWTYMGHQRLRQIARKHQAQIQLKPFDLGMKVFPVSGGVPVSQRPPQRQAYRLVELARWSRFLNLPLVIKPKFFPVAADPAARLVIAADQTAGVEKALDLAGRILRGVWADERNIADDGTLIAMANEVGLDGRDLLAKSAHVQTTYDQYSQQAIDQQVFGAPWYVFNGEPFWGQDRLELLDHALSGS
jgi:2-hydroxychromene-2-carboxylate isomerase